MAINIEELDTKLAVHCQKITDFIVYQERRNEKEDKFLEELRVLVLPLVEKVKTNTAEIENHEKNHWQWFTASLGIAGIVGGIVGFFKGQK